MSSGTGILEHSSQLIFGSSKFREIVPIRWSANHKWLAAVFQAVCKTMHKAFNIYSYKISYKQKPSYANPKILLECFITYL